MAWTMSGADRWRWCRSSNRINRHVAGGQLRRPRRIDELEGGLLACAVGDLECLAVQRGHVDGADAADPDRHVGGG